MTDYLTLEDVLTITDEMGLVVRDPGLLAGAVARPAASAFGADAYPSLQLKIAALIDGVNRNHALLDGNKRLSWVCGAVFERLNGLDLAAGQQDIFDTISRVAAGDVSLEELAGWVETTRGAGLRDATVQKPAPVQVAGGDPDKQPWLLDGLSRIDEAVDPAPPQ